MAKGAIMHRRLLVVLALSAGSGAAALLACASDATTPSGADAGDDGGATEAGLPPPPPPGAAGADGASADDGGGPGAECSFNRDCAAALRCECTEANGCACAPGARGTGKNGIDRCDAGEDCASAVCVEGPGGVYYCSDECKTSGDCTGALPVCADIALVGRICIRDGG
jgi:hypothetical protein